MPDDAGYWFADNAKSRAEPDGEKLQKVWIWVACCLENNPALLPDGDWRPILFGGIRTDKRESWVDREPDLDELKGTLEEKGYGICGMLQTWREVKYPVIHLFERARDRVISGCPDGNFSVKRYFAYDKSKTGLNVRSRESRESPWYKYFTLQLGPFSHWKNDIIASLDTVGFLEYEEVNVVDKKTADLLRPRGVTKVFVFVDGTKTKEDRDETYEFTAWTIDPEGKNLPGGYAWAFETIAELDQWTKFTHWDAEKILASIATKGWHIDRVLYPWGRQARERLLERRLRFGERESEASRSAAGSSVTEAQVNPTSSVHSSIDRVLNLKSKGGH